VNNDKRTDSAELTEALRNAETVLAASDKGELPLPARKRIWVAMGPKETWGPRAIVGPPLRRRTALAALAAKQVLPIWQEAFPGNGGPERILAITQAYLEQQIEYIAASDSRDRFWTELEKLGGTAVTAGFAAVNVLSTALNDERFDARDLDSVLDTELDPYEWDAGFYASITYAGGAPWETTSDTGARRRFWQWYIRDAAPSAWAKGTQPATRTEGN
jgi:hypothetical protein